MLTHLPFYRMGRWAIVPTPDGWCLALAEGGLDVVVWAELGAAGGWSDGWCVYVQAGEGRRLLVAWTHDPDQAADLVVEHAYLRCALAVGDVPALRAQEGAASLVQ